MSETLSRSRNYTALNFNATPCPAIEVSTQSTAPLLIQSSLPCSSECDDRQVLHYFLNLGMVTIKAGCRAVGEACRSCRVLSSSFSKSHAHPSFKNEDLFGPTLLHVHDYPQLPHQILCIIVTHYRLVYPLLSQQAIQKGF